jgi:hypothetical protein
VPKGRGPFKSWEDAAVDALTNCAPFAARWRDWSIGGILTLLEQYNGLGYAARGVASPYVWAGTDQYVSGKYVRDGVYDPNVVDRQLGCADLLLAMMKLDSSIQFGAPHANDNRAGRGSPDRPGRRRRASGDRRAAAVDHPSGARLDRGVDRVLVQAGRLNDAASCRAAPRLRSVGARIFLDFLLVPLAAAGLALRLVARAGRGRFGWRSWPAS